MTRSFATAEELVAFRIEDAVAGAKTSLRRLEPKEIETYVDRGKDRLGKSFILTPVEGIASISVDLPGGGDEGLTVEILSYATTAGSQENNEYIQRKPHWSEPDRAVVGGHVRRWGYRVTSAGPIERTRIVANVVEDALGMYYRFEDPTPSPTPRRPRASTCCLTRWGARGRAKRRPSSRT